MKNGERKRMRPSTLLEKSERTKVVVDALQVDEDTPFVILIVENVGER